MATQNTLPSVVQLTQAEAKLLDKIDFNSTRHEVLRASCVAAGSLAKSLLARGAIPEVRIRYFTDPECNPGSRKSRKQIFESNGTSGEDILSHGNFLRHLRYFIFGPDLPANAIASFCAHAYSSPYISSEDILDLKALAKASVRSHRLEPREAAEEFFKLSLECGANPSYATILRDAIRTMRYKAT